MKQLSFFRTAVGFAVLVVCAAMSAFAYDADTIAFYPFKEAAPGTSAAGITIVNDAGGGCPGTVTMSTETGIVYHADVPGKYILASSFAVNPTPEILYTNPGCVHFTGSGSISFEGLSTAISSNDDYTIEFFYKIQEEDRPGVSPGMDSCSLKYNVGTYFPGDDTGTVSEGYYPTCLTRSTDQYWQFYYAGYNLKVGGKSTSLAASVAFSGQSGWNGEWHHMALVYSKTTRKLTAYPDYNARNRSTSLSNVTNTVLDTSVPLALGLGKFRGLVSCLRVSKRALTTGEFLHASHLDAYPETTVFHYKLDGVAGETATVITNYACGGYPYAGQFHDWDPTKQMKLYSGNAEVHVATSTNSQGQSVTVGAEWSDKKPFGKSMVDDGTSAKPYLNGGSGHFHSLQRMHETGVLDGSGIYLSGTDYQHVTSGSFTMELTMKLDYSTWRSKLNATFLRFPIALLYSNTSYFFEWQLCAIMDGDNCFRVDANAYFPSGHTLKTVAHCNGTPYNRPEPNLLKDDKWHHIALVYDDDTYTFRLYIDYALKDEQTFDAPFRPSYTTYEHVWIGAGGKVNLASFEGWIDEVRYTRKALSPEQFITFKGMRGTMIIVR